MKKKEEQNPEEVEVKLKPLFGLQPGLYLTVIYAAALAVLLFLILFLPGIKKNGTEITFRSLPERVPVFIDGQYRGTTPCTLFVESGKREIEFRREFYQSVRWTQDVKGRLFGSLFFPRRDRLLRQLEQTDPAGFLAAHTGDLAQLALIGQFRDNYQPRPVIREAVEGSVYAGKGQPQRVEDFLYGGLPHITTPELLRDYVDGSALLASGGRVLTPEGLLRFLRDNLSLLDKNPGLPFLIHSLLPEDIQDTWNDAPAYTALWEGYRRRVSNSFPEAPVPRTRLTIAGVRFINLSGGSFVMGNDGLSLPHIVETGSFFMADREITKAQFQRFIIENPRWAPDKRETLLAEGLVNADYLRNWNDLGPDAPLIYVSFYAAEAYCRWLSAKPLPSGYTASLPTEAQWEWAAQADIAADPVFADRKRSGAVAAEPERANPLGIHDLTGNLWEWCADWYAPGSYFVAFNDGRKPAGIEKSVRGGSWANERAEVTYQTRGSQPPDWCTETLGFRPVIRMKNGR